MSWLNYFSEEVNDIYDDLISDTENSSIYEVCENESTFFLDIFKGPQKDDYPQPQQSKEQSPSLKYQLPVMSFDQFIKYIHTKINKDNNYFITSNMLMKIEESFINEFGNEWIRLTRDEKRKKDNIFKGLYKNVNLIHKALEENPNKYLQSCNTIIIQKYCKKKLTTIRSCILL